MKKHGLLKILGILLLLILITTYIIPSSQGTIAYTGLIDIPINFFGIVLQNFCYIVLFVLVVGGFYGLLNKTPAYKKLLDNIVTKVKPLGKKFIFIIIILFALITSFTGMTIELIVFIPFIISIILLLGYDKLVALSATIVSTMVGYMGGVLVSFINPNTYSISTYESFVGASSEFVNTFPKLLLLVSGIALLIGFVNKHIMDVEKKKVKYELDDNSELLINEVKGKYKNIKTWPLIIILSFVFVILILGMIPWNSLFEITVFTDLHTWLTGLSIKEFAIIPNILSSSLPALGEWNLNGNPWFHYIFICILVLFATVIVAIVNRISIDDMLDNYTDGCKKALPAAALITIAYTVLVCSFNNGFLNHIIAETKTFNFGISSLLAFLGCLLNVDAFYIIAGSFSPIVNLITDESIYESVAILLQGIYGIFSIIGPTSMILIFGLSYFNVPYTTWLKYIWRFVLAIILLLALVVCLVVLL